MAEPDDHPADSPNEQGREPSVPYVDASVDANTDLAFAFGGGPPATRQGIRPDAGASPSGSPTPSGFTPGDRVDRYELLEVLGEGGFGSVYLAQQEKPVRRQVALKVIKLGMDTREVIARFEAERQALAIMDHPSIAKVFDAGMTPFSADGGVGGGRPYFVMEFVKGSPITEYCDRNRLSTGQRLELFVRVCHALQHAHQSGIIHRDVKPSNILVTVHDGQPVPKVIDFGIAKAIEVRLSEETIVTAFNRLIGTPVYMSPEQADLSGPGVDTRSDIYALGVLLYELLTGTTPFDSETLLAGGYADLQRVIREQDPPTPSNRLSSLSHQARAALAQRRQLDARTLRKHLRGDLDWIVMKALAKDRERRYQTAVDFARDVGRYLEDRPVDAGPPRAMYRAAKFARRNRLAVMMSAAILLVLLAGLAASIYGFLDAASERDNARQEATKSQAAQQRLRRALYAADIPAVQSSLANLDFGRARDLLRSHIPGPDEEDLRGFEWHHFSGLARGGELFALHGHDAPVTGVAFSPDGKALASLGTDGKVCLWNLETRRLTAVLPPGDDIDRSASLYEVPVSVAFAPDGKTLVVGSSRMVHFWNLREEEPELTRSLESSVPRVVFSPDGKTMALGSGGMWYGEAGGEVELFRYPSLEKWAVLPDAGGRVAFSRDGRLLATGMSKKEKAIKLWHAGRAELAKTFEAPERVVSLCLSPDGGTLAAGDLRGAIHVWSTESGEEIGVVRHEYSVQNLHVSADGLRLISSSQDHSVRIWDLESLAEAERLVGHAGEVWSMAASPDGSLLASGDKEGAVYLWSLEHGGKMEVIEGVRGYHWGFFPVVSPDGRRVAALRADGLGIWSLETARLERAITGKLEPLGFVDDSQTLIAVEMPLTLHAIDAEAGTVSERLSLEKPNGSVRFMELSPNGRLLAGWASDVYLWDAATGGLLSTFKGDVYVRAADFSPDGTLLATGENGGAIRIWNLESRRLVSVLAGHGLGVLAVTFSADGQILASGGLDGVVKLWRVGSWGEIVTLAGHKQAIVQLAFAHDGRTLASSSDDLKIKLWSIDTHRELATFERDHTAWTLLFTPDDRMLIAGGEDNQLRLYRAETLDEISSE